MRNRAANTVNAAAFARTRAGAAHPHSGECGYESASPQSAIRNPQSAIATRGFTLIEVLVTLLLLAILAAALIPQLSSDLPERLQAGAEIVAADLEYARSLAVANNSTYRITFDTGENLYYLQHTGSNNLLNALPPSPFRQNDDPPDRQTTDLDLLPIPPPTIRLIAVAQGAAGPLANPQIDYQPLGGTQGQEETVIWLGCGGGTSARFVSIHIHPVTGLAEIGPLLTALPADIAP
ncbi:MAG TPA: prepilin-type N-terminal cleavage/methylation domain-containing protein [Pirellulaceae bacterium]|nr:prepilin-type N-terminal cleavage/methylation domain-containing protein [Pirellulaceae bacterium]